MTNSSDLYKDKNLKLNTTSSSFRDSIMPSLLHLREDKLLRITVVLYGGRSLQLDRFLHCTVYYLLTNIG